MTGTADPGQHVVVHATSTVAVAPACTWLQVAGESPFSSALGKCDPCSESRENTRLEAAQCEEGNGLGVSLLKLNAVANYSRNSCGY